MKRLTTLSVVVATLVLGGCSSSSSTSASTSGSTELTVFAASSLTAAFNQIGSDFESANPGTTVTFNYGSSTDLATQIGSEGTADVFASASGTAMDTVAKDPGVTDRTDFATNQLVIITPTDDPAGVSTLQDLTKPGVQVVLGAAAVPVGDYARQMLDENKLTDEVMPNVVSNEADDASVVAKVNSGEADAAIVYASDVASNTDVRAVPIPTNQNVVATYPIAVVTGSSIATVAKSFVTHVTGSQGEATLQQFGFGPPPTG
ncbi:MAG TPA: molybdate ABC transporter substrate-binding protein [Actinomycetota bacterium]|nr:molybdate ABC transporter substrate-binding protein [Actinomycetota bacterium]